MVRLQQVYTIGSLITSPPLNSNNGKKGCFKLFGTSFFIGGRYVIIQVGSAFTVTDMVMDAGGMKRCLKH